MVPWIPTVCHALLHTMDSLNQGFLVVTFWDCSKRTWMEVASCLLPTERLSSILLLSLEAY